MRGITATGFAAGWSTAIDFYVAPSPVPMTGSGSTFNRRPGFSWQPVVGAVSYSLTVRDRNTGEEVIRETNIRSTTFTVPSDLRIGPYRWWVLAASSRGLMSQSGIAVDLYVGGRPAVQVENVNGQRPLIRWGVVDGAANFRIHIDRLDVPKTAAIVASNLQSNSFVIPTHLPPGTYRAWVRAVSISGELSPWSLDVTFRVASLATGASNVDVNEDESRVGTLLPKSLFLASLRLSWSRTVRQSVSSQSCEEGLRQSNEWLMGHACNDLQDAQDVMKAHYDLRKESHEETARVPMSHSSTNGSKEDLLGIVTPQLPSEEQQKPWA